MFSYVCVIIEILLWCKIKQMTNVIFYLICQSCPKRFFKFLKSKLDTDIIYFFLKSWESCRGSFLWCCLMLILLIFKEADDACFSFKSNRQKLSNFLSEIQQWWLSGLRRYLKLKKRECHRSQVQITLGACMLTHAVHEIRPRLIRTYLR